MLRLAVGDGGMWYAQNMSNEGKQRLVDAARRLIARQGVAAATMRAIAAEAGLSTGAIYHHYKNREDILSDALARNLSETARIRGETRRAGASRAEIIDEIAVNIARRYEKREDNRLQFQLIEEALSNSPPLLSRLQDKYRDWILGGDELIQWVLDRPPSPGSRAAAAFLLAAIDGSVIQHQLEVGELSPDDMERIFRAMLTQVLPALIDELDGPTDVASQSAVR